MKKKTIILFSLLVLIAGSCYESVELKKQEPSMMPHGAAAEDGKAAPFAGFGIMSTCGGNFDGSYTVINSYYTYPLQTVDVSCAASGATVTVNVYALDVPNRFTVLDANNNPVAGTSWLGNAAYSGPWGSSLSNSGTATITFAKSSSTYKLRVETLTPPDYSYYPTTDAWQASFSCACSSCTTCPCVACPTGYICVNGTCVPDNCNCGGFFDGTYNVINSHYFYPLETVDVSCAAANATITVNCSALDVPNRFTILDQNNNFVTGSNWIGTANYPGPWGASLSTSGSTTLTFSKTGNTYKIKVETVTPPDYSYYPTTDYWDASVTCP